MQPQWGEGPKKGFHLQESSREVKMHTGPGICPARQPPLHCGSAHCSPLGSSLSSAWNLFLGGKLPSGWPQASACSFSQVRFLGRNPVSWGPLFQCSLVQD